MQSPNPPRPPYPPRPGWIPGASDPRLAAVLAARPVDADARTGAVALLFARHWRAALDYATVCLAGGEDTARLVAAAAFHDVLGRLEDGRTRGALRPQLLVAVRETVRDWAGADTVADVLPELRKTVGGRGLRAARPVTAERRQLAERSFQLLPAASQCLLWHTEVEADPLSVPAGLSGVDILTAKAAVEQAREQFRAGCVRAHRELAPTSECRFYNRLLDIPLRRGGTLLPDVRQHLAHCRFCRHAAEQLSHFDDGLGVLLAETVLGWGARRYLDSRPGRTDASSVAAPVRPAGQRPPAATGRHRTTSAGLLDLPGRRPKAVLVGVGLTSLALLATVFVAKGWSDDNGVPASGATWGAPAGGSGASVTGTRKRPGGPGEPPPSGAPTTAPASRSAQVAHGALRGPGTDLCLDTAGGRTRAGAAIVVARCAGTASQQWSYEGDGPLRSAADPALCLAADPGRRTTVLGGCLVHAGETFFDLTVRGELLLRRDEGLAVARAAAGPGAAVVVARRDGGGGQRWVFEAPAPGQGAPGPGGAAPPLAPAPSGSPQAGEAPASGDDRDPAPDTAPARTAPASPESGTGTGNGNGNGFAQVRCCGTAPAPAAPADPVATVVGALPVPAAVPEVVTDAVPDVLGSTLADVTGSLGH
ncbi:ricin-type beta-trefoil lectin domain protein [Streptomyces asoensis]